SASKPTPTQRGMVPGCLEFHQAAESDSCEEIVDENEISVVDFVSWNSAVRKLCNNLFVGYWFC
ncbi:hypothetical protein DOTSEDRAFT_102290, partial [Dothistroma septosporum NZE10]